MSTEEPKKKKKGNFFTNLLFTSEESSDNVEKDATDNISVSNSGAQSISPTATVSPVAQNFNLPITGDGVFDKKFSDSLQQLIAENNVPGIDFFEFSQALKGMSGVAGLSEATSFQTIFTTLKVGDPSLTKEKLVASIDHYLAVLKKEEQEFKAEMNASAEQEVLSRRNKAEKLNADNLDLIQQIQNINEKIARNQEESLKLNSEAASAEAVIGQTHKNFITTLAHVTSSLEADKMKVSQLIKE